jgi:nitrate/nitrite-specific signal transduction histidine kinase
VNHDETQIRVIQTIQTQLSITLEAKKMRSSKRLISVASRSVVACVYALNLESGDC